jgi:hypothetical protein
MAPFSPVAQVYCWKGGFAKQNVSTTLPPVFVQSAARASVSASVEAASLGSASVEPPSFDPPES